MYSSAEANLNSQSKSKTVMSKSLVQLPTKVMLTEGGELGGKEFEDVSDWQPGCGLPVSKYKAQATNNRIIGVSGGECTNDHAFPWMARLVG